MLMKLSCKWDTPFSRELKLIQLWFELSQVIIFKMIQSTFKIDQSMFKIHQVILKEDQVIFKIAKVQIKLNLI